MSRRLLRASLGLVLVSLAGCYYEPAYRHGPGNGYGGDAYYGADPAPSYYSGAGYSDYYDPGYGTGCCYYSNVIVEGGYRYRGGRYYPGDRRGWAPNDHRGGPWQGRGPGPGAPGGQRLPPGRPGAGGGQHPGGHGAPPAPHAYAGGHRNDR